MANITGWWVFPRKKVVSWDLTTINGDLMVDGGLPSGND
jgi:hypothetical protein